MMKRNLAIVLVLLFSISFVTAITGSMGNARMILYPEVNGWTTTTIEKTILTKNVNDVEITIKLETDADFLKIIDGEFVLQPGEEKKAKFEVRVKKVGTYEGKINVFFSPTDEEGPGVALSSTVIVVAAKDQDYRDDGTDDDDSEEDGVVSVITGGIIGSGDGESSKGLIILVLSSLILLVVLIVLIVIMNKKKKNERVKSKESISKNKKDKTKESKK